MTPGTRVSGVLSTRGGKRTVTGVVVGTAATVKGPFLVVRKDDGAEVRLRPGTVTAV